MKRKGYLILACTLCVMLSMDALALTLYAAETSVLSLESLEGKLREIDSNAKRITEDNIRLRNLMKKIDAPMSGVEEVIRREKLKLLTKRINTNIDQLQQIRQQQERLQSLAKQTDSIKRTKNTIKQQRNFQLQQNLMKQQKSLPK